MLNPLTSVVIPAFDDPLMIACEGTIGLGAAVKALNPFSRVIGVQINSGPSTISSIAEVWIVSVDVGAAIDDGIVVNKPGDLNFSMICKYVDEAEQSVK